MLFSPFDQFKIHFYGRLIDDLEVSSFDIINVLLDVRTLSWWISYGKIDDRGYHLLFSHFDAATVITEALYEAVDLLSTMSPGVCWAPAHLREFDVTQYGGMYDDLMDTCSDMSNIAVISVFLLFVICYGADASDIDDGTGKSSHTNALLKWFHKYFNALMYMYLGRGYNIYYPFFFFLFLFIMCLNVAGLIPFSFSFTSQLMVTLTPAFMVWYSTILIGFDQCKLSFVKMFIPKAIPYSLVPVLLFIELMSYIFRVFSLALRLFANVVAGHILFELIGMSLYKAAFMANGYGYATFLVILSSAMLFIILVVFELFVSILQAYIFSILSFIYIRDIFMARIVRERQYARYTNQ